jgi:8-oxo-dGTP pyrophosphatase MutT (NUDIX family)
MGEKYRRGVFVAVYSRQKNKIEYLILKRKHHWKGWEFPKGGTNPFELKMHAAKREVKEETGQNLIRIKKFNIHGKYKYNKEFSDRKGIIGQTFTLFAAEVKKGKIKLDDIEHSGYEWLSFNEAMKKLTWPNQKRCLKVVNDWLLKSK